MKTVTYLKSLVLVMLALTVATMTAANVDSRAAQAKAIQFMNSQSGIRFMASPANMKLTHAEASQVKADAVDYYVFNMEGGGYIIVSGDDRAEEILGYGSGHMDVNNLPSNVAWWLGHFKEQLEFLFANPKMNVETHSMLMSTMLRASSVPALVPCTWDQEAPYYNQCPTYRNQHCLTGCVATAMAQVMYYWKYPASLPALDGYSQQANSSYGVPALTMEALPATTLEWDKMIDDYSSVEYTTEQANAVAKLMRYCGQAVHMEYSPDGSGAYSDDQRDAMVLFGYCSEADYVEKSNYNETEWHAMMQAELEAGRPIMYGGNDYSQGGHAFIVDGYNASTSKYHVNFGWSGYGDNYYALNAFSASGMTFNYYQDMIIKVYPESTLETYAPEMNDADNVGATSFRAVWTDQTPSENVTDYTLYVDEFNPNVMLTETFAGITVENDGTANIANSLDQYCDNAGWTGAYVYQGAGGTAKLGSGSYAGNLTTPALDLTNCGGTVTVKFNARYYGSDASSVVVSCGNVSQTVALTATAADYTVTLTGVTAAAGQKVKFACTAKKKRFYIDNIEITAGSAMLNATVTGDASHQVITGITSKNYTVTNLNEGGSYKFYVEANYTDGSKKQSNVKSVTLEGTPEPTPELIVDPETLTMTANAGETTTATFQVLGADLKGNVTLTMTDENGVYTINPATITKAAAEEGATVTVTYAPTALGNHEATVTVASEGAEDVTVTINGTATLQTTAPVMAAASNVGQTSFTATWTDQTAAQFVTDYTLYVNRVGAAAAMFTETFDKIDVTTDGTRDRAETLDEYCDNAGWTGNAVYEAVGGGIKLGSGSKQGYVTTPALNLTNCGGAITVALNAKSYGSDNTSITVSCGDVSETVALTAEAEDYYVVLNGVTAAEAQQVTIASPAAGKRFYLYGVAVYAGSEAAGDSRIIKGITDKTYTVEGLTAGQTYEFYVEANYVDNSKGASNHEQVTLQAPAPVPTMIVDAETLTMTAAVLETQTATIDMLASDLTGDVTVTLTDETGFFTIEPETISMADAEEGATITVTYSPTAAGEHTAIVTLSSEGAEDVTVTITATAAMDTLEPEMQPADEEYVTTTSFRADWIDVTPEQYVTSYTLYVNKKQEIPAGATLLTETFGGSEDAPEEDSNSDIGNAGSLDDFFDNAGWTGYGVYLAAGGGVKLGAGSKIGSLTTPALDLTNFGGTVTVKFRAISYGSDNSSVIVSCGEVADTIELDVIEAEYTVVLTGVPAEADQHVTLSGVANKKRFYLYSVTIIGGEEIIKAVNETGDADSRVITGITDQYYVVENLTPGATYTYYVEANYIDDTKAASNVETVTLLEEQGHGYQNGDVNHDGNVSIKDVTDLIDYLLGGNDNVCPICADVNGDQGVSIGDATALIDKLLGGNR